MAWNGNSFCISLITCFPLIACAAMATWPVHESSSSWRLSRFCSWNHLKCFIVLKQCVSWLGPVDVHVWFQLGHLDLHCMCLHFIMSYVEPDAMVLCKKREEGAQCCVLCSPAVQSPTHLLTRYPPSHWEKNKGGKRYSCALES